MANPKLFVDQAGKIHQCPEGAVIHWRMSVYLLVHDDGAILMVQPVWAQHRWELPGGGIKPGELIIEGLQRECLEETGYRVGVGGTPISVREEWFYDAPEKRFCHAAILVFPGHLREPRRAEERVPPGAEKEIARVAWVPRFDLCPQNVHTIHWQALRSVKR